MNEPNEGVTATVDAPEPQQGQGDKQTEPGDELTTLKKRYEDSSSEGKRLHGELQRALGELDAIKSSLTQKRDDEPQGFVPEKEFVTTWVEKGLPEEAARLLYQDRSNLHSAVQFLHLQNKALANRVRFAEEASSKLVVQTNPEIKRAMDFWKGIPAMETLTPSEQYDAYLKKFPQNSSSRDLSAVKASAGGPSGGSAPRGAATFTPEQDSEARDNGFPSAAAMKDFATVDSEAKKRDWDAKWLKK